MQQDARREVTRLLCVTGYALKIRSGILERLEGDLPVLADGAVKRFQRVRGPAAGPVT